MKYIRTKDGIYKVILVSPLNFVRIDKRDRTYPDVFEKDIVGKTDTIEELCDGFVVREYHYGDYFPIKTDAHYSYNSFTLLSDAKGYRDLLAKSKGKALYDLFGAIWTDKGLIYVAKMNEKGELELL